MALEIAEEKTVMKVCGWTNRQTNVQMDTTIGIYHKKWGLKNLEKISKFFSSGYDNYRKLQRNYIKNFVDRRTTK